MDKLKLNKYGIQILYIMIFVIGCEKKIEDPVVDWENHQPFKTTYSISSLSENNSFSQTGIDVNAVQLFEVSGLAESQLNKDALWAHNDSGNGNILYLLDKKTGVKKAEYRINGTQNIDWEAIEVGPGPENGINYIYLGDIGDNVGNRESVAIYRFSEPKYEPAHEGKFIELNPDIDILNFFYPEGARDAETLLLDHNTKDLYIVSKRDFPAKVYVFPYPQETNNSTRLYLAGTLPLFAPVGGNVNPNGKEILLKTYDKIFLWKHDINTPLWKTLSREPEIAPYNPIEPQGEAICFDATGDYFTLSEKVDNNDVVLYRYSRIQ